MNYPSRRRSTLRTGVVAATLLVASGSYANGQFGLSGRRKPAAPPPNSQAAPVTTGVTDVKWDGNTIRMANGRPMIIYAGTDPIQPTSRAIAAVSGNKVVVMPGIDVDPVKLQKSLDDYESMRSRGGGAPVAQTLNTLGTSEPVTGPAANGADKLTWVSGEPRVHLADGSEVTFSGGNGSKVEVISSGNAQTAELEFTEAAHSPYGVAKGVAKAIGTGLTTGSQTASLEGGAWKVQIVGGRSFNQDHGTRNVNAFVPLWVKQIVGAVLRSQQLVLADPAGHQYVFTGTKKLREVLGERP